MEMSNPLATSEPIFMQVVKSDSPNNVIKCDEEKSEAEKTSMIEQQELSSQPTNLNTMAKSEDTVDKYSKQIMSFVNEQQTHQGSLSFNESSRNDEASSFGNMMQSDSNTWQEVTNRCNSLEPGECLIKLDGSENPQGMNLDLIEGQVLLGMGVPEWGEVLQKDDDGRLLEMNFMGCDAEKRMLRATIIERSKEISRLQKELNTVFQIIHQLKQENEYLTQQQHYPQLQQQSPQQSIAQQDAQQTNDPKNIPLQDVQHPTLTSPTVQSTDKEQQEFLAMQTATCPPAQQNDQLLLLELLNHIPPQTKADM